MGRGSHQEPDRFSLAGVSLGSGYQVVVRYDALVGPGIGFSDRSFEVVPLAISKLTQFTGSFTQASGLRMTWTTSGPVSQGYFDVSVQGPGGTSYTYYNLGSVTANGSSSYAANFTLATVPVGSNYRVVVRHFGGEFAGASSGYFVVAPLTINVKKITGSYSKRSSLPVSWTTSDPVFVGGFKVSVQRSLDGTPYDLGSVPANGAKSYATIFSLANVPASVFSWDVYYVVVKWSGSSISAASGTSDGYFTVVP